jgi:hypothetical protein
MRSSCDVDIRVTLNGTSHRLEMNSRFYAAVPNNMDKDDLYTSGRYQSKRKCILKPFWECNNLTCISVDCSNTYRYLTTTRYGLSINPLAPKDVYIRRTAQLTSRRCILNIYSTNILTEYFKHAAHSQFFFLFKMPFIS